MIEPARKAAWRAHAAEVERQTHLVGLLFVAVLMPMWGVVDVLLEPARVAEFFGLRGAVSAVALGAWLAVWRRARLVVRRLVFSAAILFTGGSIAWMLRRIDSHYFEYTLGFSLLFWGLGILSIWPVQLTVAVDLALLAVHWLLGWREGLVPADTQVGLNVYLLSAGAVGAGVNGLRRTLERRAFLASLDLERRNAELAAALRTLEEAQARMVATEKLSALGRLLAQLSHEINNPVNVLQNNIEPIAEHAAALGRVADAARQVPGAAGDAVRALWAKEDVDFARRDLTQALADMRTAAGRVRGVHQDLRAFLRGDGPGFAPGDVNEQVRATVAIFRRNLPERVTLSERLGELPPLDLIAGQVGQVVLNLLQNALDAVGASGTVDVSTALDGDAVVLVVQDSGPGVSAAARAHLFEPFFSTKEVGRGTGLGLATSYQIVQRHGGSLALDGAYVGGARFVVRLPLKRGAPAGPG